MTTHDGKTPDVQSMRPYMAKENTFTTSLTFGSRLGDHNLLVGAQAYLTKLREAGLYCIADETSQYLGEAYTSLGKKHATEFGFFAQDEWNIQDKLSVVRECASIRIVRVRNTSRARRFLTVRSLTRISMKQASTHVWPLNMR